MIYKRPDSIEISKHNYITIYGEESVAKQRLYNIGAGAWSHDCWTNIDLPPQTEAFAAIQAPCIYHDLVKQSVIPIPTETVDAFYSSHVVEHLPEDTVLNLMKETFRCLAKGGICRIVTGPCADLDWNALMRGDENWWFWFQDADFQKTIRMELGPPTIYDKWLYTVAGPRSLYSKTECERKYSSIEIKELVLSHKTDPVPLLNMLTQSLPFKHASAGDHITWWNYDKLRDFMKEAGFTRIYRSAYAQSISMLMRDLRYFDETFPQVSVYLEAIK